MKHALGRSANATIGNLGSNLLPTEASPHSSLYSIKPYSLTPSVDLLPSLALALITSLSSPDPAMASNGVRAEEKKNQQQLLQAASSGDLPLLKQLARSLDNRGEGLAETIKGIESPTGLCALHCAAARGNTHVCHYLIRELGIPVNFLSRDGQTPLLYAAYEGQSSTVRYLIEQGADPNATDKECATPLLHAATFGYVEIVKLLLSRGVPVDFENHRGTPLHQAASHCHESVMKILLKHGADINKIAGDMLTPLLNSIIALSLKCTKFLIKAGADVNLKCPLSIAVFLNQIEIIKALLEAGADPNNPNDVDDQLPIEVAALNDRKEIVKILFPLTSPISQVKRWSIEGLYIHVNSDAFRQKLERVSQEKLVDTKMKGADAFKRKDFLTAVGFYNRAIMSDPKDAKLFANRSLCYLKAGFGEQALKDACLAQSLRPDWPKAYYRIGASLMLLKDFKKASQAFEDGLKLDPTNEEISEALQNALDCMSKSRQ